MGKITKGGVRKMAPESEEWSPEPKDNKTWWRASHCGHGSICTGEECECGRNVVKCAEANTRAIEEHKREIDMDCGCSGFWCWKCGRFWAQDSCWERTGSEYASSDGETMSEKGDFVHCVCGIRLYKMATEEEYRNGDRL